MISVEVKYLDRIEGLPVAGQEIKRIFVASETEHAVVLSVETVMKYPHPELYSGCGVQFRTVAGNLADVRVRGIPFDHPMVIAEAGRYSLFVIVFHDVPEDGRQVYDIQ